MRRLRRHRGFELAGRLPADQLGLTRARGTELVLAATWRQVAGEAIARRARALRVRRGVLEIEVLDERWLETVRSLIPRLAGRLGALRPELGVKRFRLRRQDPGETEGALPVAGEEETATAPDPGTTEEAGREPPGSITPERLEAAMERYLRRADRP